mmetsp:Transcript_20035/g.17714  ORF Transcript_20035/g.17714 Transcript_20035/m.17714 type:complete len:99 (+) Transcript_20035:387-683(+)
MNQLMSNSYGQEAEKSIRSRYEFHSQNREKSKTKKPIKVTRAVNLLTKYKIKSNLHNPLEDFKLKKYKQIKSLVKKNLENQIKKLKERNSKSVNKYQL